MKLHKEQIHEALIRAGLILKACPIDDTDLSKYRTYFIPERDDIWILLLCAGKGSIANEDSVLHVTYSTGKGKLDLENFILVVKKVNEDIATNLLFELDSLFEKSGVADAW